MYNFKIGSVVVETDMNITYVCVQVSPPAFVRVTRTIALTADDEIAVWGLHEIDAPFTVDGVKTVASITEPQEFGAVVLDARSVYHTRVGDDRWVRNTNFDKSSVPLSWSETVQNYGPITEHVKF